MRRSIIVYAFLLSGCSTYPLPEDVTSYNTVDLTTQVKCDARHAIQKYLFEENFGYAKDTVVYNGMTGTQTKAWLQSDPKNYRKFNWKLLSEKAKGLAAYGNTIVGMDFTLDGEGQNDNGFSATVLGQFTKHTDTIGIDFGHTLTREVKRKYRTFDSFESLALRMDPDICKDFHIVDKASTVPEKSYNSRPELIYPDTGALKLDDLIHSFLVLNERENLGGTTSTDWKTADMFDTITYTTKVDGNLTPSADIKNQALGFSLSKIGLTSKNFRLDTHTIIVDISLPADTKASPIFDQDGFLALKANTSKDIERVSRNLDKAQESNFRDDFRNVATALRERN